MSLFGSRYPMMNGACDSSKRMFKMNGAESEDGILKRTRKSRKSKTLEEKIQVLDRLAHGERVATVARHFGLNESTVRSIKRKEVAIRKSVACGALESSKATCMLRDYNLQRMERELYSWIQEQSRKNAPLSTAMICDKAKELYEHFHETYNWEMKITKRAKFKASKGWYENFKRRFNLHSLKQIGENLFEDSVEVFEEKFFKKEEEIPEENFHPEDIVAEDFVELIQTSPGSSSDEEIENSVTIKDPDITYKNVSAAIVLAQKLAEYMIEIDPDKQRSLIFKQGLEQLLEPYTEVQNALEIEMIKRFSNGDATPMNFKGKRKVKLEIEGS